MTILKMDARAIEVLFPEGSEQRLELQKCVIAEFAKNAWSARNGLPKEDIETYVRQVISNYTVELRKGLDEAFRKVQTEQLKGLGYVSETTANRWAGSVKEIKLTQSVTDQIRAEARSAVQGAISEEIRTLIKDSVQRAIDSGSTRMLVKSLVEEAVKADVIAQVQQLLKKV